MFKDWNYKEAIQKAHALHEIGQVEVYLSEKTDLPWHLVTKCEPGGSHRLDIDTDVWFYAYDPSVELTFRWSFDIEPRSANGKGVYQIDIVECEKVLNKLPPTAKDGFKKYLLNCADSIAKHVDELESYLNKEKDSVRALRVLSSD